MTAPAQEGVAGDLLLLLSLFVLGGDLWDKPRALFIRGTMAKRRMTRLQRPGTRTTSMTLRGDRR
jgi:hypothetical protein